MAWMIPQLWNHSGYLNAYTSFLGQKSQNTLGRCTRYLRSKNSFFTGVPFLILGRKVFNCQHGIDRTAGEKRKRKDAEEVLYIIFSFYPQPLCYCQLWLANSKGQIHTTGGPSSRLEKKPTMVVPVGRFQSSCVC